MQSIVFKEGESIPYQDKTLDFSVLFIFLNKVSREKAVICIPLGLNPIDFNKDELTAIKDYLEERISPAANLLMINESLCEGLSPRSLIPLSALIKLKINKKTQEIVSFNFSEIPEDVALKKLNRKNDKGIEKQTK